MGQKMVRFAQLGAARSRQDEPMEVGEVGSKRPSSGCNGVHVLSLYPLIWRSLSRAKAAPHLHEQGRVGDNVYEVFQVQPRSRMQQDILIKNDPGAQITFIDPGLFKFGLKEGFIRNQRDFETEEMLGIGGSTYINRQSLRRRTRRQHHNYTRSLAVWCGYRSV